MTENLCDAELEEQRWNVVVARTVDQRDPFVYAVRTTGVYCRSNCSSRLPKRANVKFFDSAGQAKTAGFRACRRCQPDQTSPIDHSLEDVMQACRFIEFSESTPKLAEVANCVGMSTSHLHRIFRRHLGITPKQFASEIRTRRLKESLEQPDSNVTQAILDAGFESSGRCYSESAAALGMTPGTYRRRGTNMDIRFSITDCSLGRLLVAATAKGICQIALGDDDDTLVHALIETFPNASQVTLDQQFEKLLADVVALIEQPNRRIDLPLDIQGTVFQRKVWQALREIAPGETATYKQVAESIGDANASRAVAAACAANPLAVAIPCHRVVRSNGTLSGYRWGVHRKQTLLERESKVSRRVRK